MILRDLYTSLRELWRNGLKHDGRAPEVGDFIPVWWEFHTFDADGNEQLNDFSFGQLRSRL